MGARAKLAVRNNRNGLFGLSVGGFKSISERVNLVIRPLTVLAGANSSGKSSVMQPLLLLKQTLDAAYDPGSLLLNGANVKFTDVTQIVPIVREDTALSPLHVGLEFDYPEADYLGLNFAISPRTHRVDVSSTDYKFCGFSFSLVPGMPSSEIQESLIKAQSLRKAVDDREAAILKSQMLDASKVRWEVARRRCFLSPSFEPKMSEWVDLAGKIPLLPIPTSIASRLIQSTIHIPGNRGNPERAYPVTAVPPEYLGFGYQGSFLSYVAGIIADFQRRGKKERLARIGAALERLGLSDNVRTRNVDDTQVSILVTRQISRKAPSEWVDLADVGLGTSQVLPILVALEVAEIGQMVYIEQPELHLHPKAQVKLASEICRASARGVHVVVETHSALMLLAFQTEAATNRLHPESVVLHWFSRKRNGATKVRSSNLDKIGAFGSWPSDFDETQLAAQQKYLKAALG